MKLQDPEYRLTLGTIGFFWSLIVATLGMFNILTLNVGVFTSVVGFSSGLLTVGILKRFSKNPEGQEERNANIS